MDAKYRELLIQKTSLIFLIIGSFICLIMAIFNYNILGKQLSILNALIRTLLLLIGVAGIIHVFRRDFYLPFLGETVMPCAGLEDRIPSGADTAIQITVTPNSKVFYWASEPAADELKQITDWKLAYSTYKNFGVTTSNSSGIATLRVRKPQPYTVPFKGRLEPHIHYRICSKDGFLERVNTVFINNNSSANMEGFTNMEFITNVDQNKLISELTRDPKRISDIINLLPGITNIMTQLNTIVTRDVVPAGEQAHSSADALNGQTINEAFSNY